MPHLDTGPENLNDRPSRMELFIRRRKRMVKPAIVIFFLFFLFGTGAFVISSGGDNPTMVMLRNRIANLFPLHVSEIIIRGDNLTSTDDIKAMLGVQKGDPILKFSVEEARKKIDTLPFVDHSSIERRLPGTIIVEITERAPFAVWQHQGHFVLIDRAGNVVANKGMTGKDAQAYMQLPLVVGSGANISAGDLIDILANYPAIKERTTAAIRIGERRWNLQLRDGTIILLPEAEEQAALKRLTELHTSNQLLDRPVAAIDMRLPDRLIIRQRNIPPPPAPPEEKHSEMHLPYPLLLLFSFNDLRHA